MAARWNLMACTLSWSRRAASAFVRPTAIICSTSSSRGVSATSPPGASLPFTAGWLEASSSMKSSYERRAAAPMPVGPAFRLAVRLERRFRRLDPRRRRGTTPHHATDLEPDLGCAPEAAGEVDPGAEQHEE